MFTNYSFGKSVRTSTISHISIFKLTSPLNSVENSRKSCHGFRLTSVQSTAGDLNTASLLDIVGKRNQPRKKKVDLKKSGVFWFNA